MEGLTFILALKILALLLAANGTPIIAKRILHARWNTPLDFGTKFIDGRDVFGRSKTWRGLVSSIVATSILAMILGYPAWVGAVVAAGSMLGDLLSSFIKRRLDISASGRALGLDQIPEALLPLLLLYQLFELDAVAIVVLVIVFTAGSLVLSRLMYWLGVREHPY